MGGLYLEFIGCRWALFGNGRRLFGFSWCCRFIAAIAGMGLETNWEFLPATFCSLHCRCNKCRFVYLHRQKSRRGRGGEEEEKSKSLVLSVTLARRRTAKWHLLMVFYAGTHKDPPDLSIISHKSRREKRNKKTKYAALAFVAPDPLTLSSPRTPHHRTVPEMRRARRTARPTECMPRPYERELGLA
jgi:hypothetical protein